MATMLSYPSGALVRGRQASFLVCALLTSLTAVPALGQGAPAPAAPVPPPASSSAAARGDSPVSPLPPLSGPVTEPAQAPGGAPAAIAPAPATPAPAAIAPTGPVAAPMVAPAPVAQAQAAAVPAVRELMVGDSVGVVLKRVDGVVVVSRANPSVDQVGMAVAFRDELGDEVVVGRVVRVKGRTLDVRVGLNEDVPMGATAYFSQQRPTGSLVAPILADYGTSVAVTLRPWLGLGQTPSGVLVDALVKVRLGERARLTVGMEPGSPALGATSGALETYVAPSFNSKLAEVGFALGAGTINDPLFTQPGLGFLLGPILRVGSEDGLHARMRISAIVRDGVAQFGSYRLDGQIPLAYGLQLLVEGGGGSSGYSYGDLGIRVLLSGNGGRGSWFAKALVGGAGTSSGYSTSGGPSFGLGVEARF